MGVVVTFKRKPFLKHWFHKLFECGTYWNPRTWYHCTRCSKTLKCYWDGNDVTGHGIDFCDKCAAVLEDGDE